MPKIKMTGNQRFMPRAESYVLWKEHVVRSFLQAYQDDQLYRRNVVLYTKPITLGPTECALMLVRLFWANKAHGDPENVFGSIADALFKNDKELDVIALSQMTDCQNDLGKPQGYAIVHIFIFSSVDEKRSFIKRNIKI